MGAGVFLFLNSELYMLNEYMRRDAAAKYLGISPRTLSDWQKRRLVPYIKPARKCTLFKRVELDRAMARLTVQSVGGESQINSVAP